MSDRKAQLANREIEQKDWQTPGIMLRNMRRQLNLDLEEVRRQLGLTQRALKALEADEYHRLPADTYVRGYIRRYCAILKIGEDEVLECYESFKEERTDDKQQLSKTEVCCRNRKPWLIPVAVLVVLLLVLALRALSAADDAKQSGFASSTIGESIEVSREEQNYPQENPPSEYSSSETVISGELEVSVSVDSWIEVVDSHGEILMADLKQAGDNVTLYGHAPFDVLLGFAPGVTLSHAGRRVELPPSRNSTVKLKVGD